MQKSVIALGLVLVVGCGSSSESSSTSPQQLCARTCSKSIECLGSTLVGNQEQCEERCNSGESDQSPDLSCNPSDSELEACISAYESVDCTDLLSEVSQVAQACDLCEESDSDAGTNMNNGDAGVGTGDAGPELDAAMASAECAELRDECCSTLDGAEKIACDAAVSANVPEGCGGAYMVLCPFE